MNFTKYILFALVISFSLPAFSDILPLEYFANLPDVSNVDLSPNGSKVSAVVRIDVGESKGMGVQVTNLETGKVDIVLFTDNSKYFLGDVWWKDNKTLLVETWFPADRDTWTGLRQARFKTRETRLLIIDTETGEVNSPFSSRFLRRYKILPSVLSDVIDNLPDDPDHILMDVPSTSGWGFQSSVLKINIKKQSNKTIQKPEDRFSGWATDQYGQVRIAFHWEDDGVASTMIKDHETGKWLEYWPYKVFSEDEVDVLGFGEDPNTVYINAYHNDFKAVFKVNLKDKDLKRELVYADPNYDVSGYLIYAPKTKKIIGIGSGREEGTKFIAPEYEALQNGIDKALPGRRNFIYAITDNENNYLVYSTGPRESGTYYLGTKNPVALKAIAYRYKNLSPSVLAKVERIEYKARDGVNIEAYLTLPKDLKPEKLPTLMFPHGGPISRDSKAFDYWAQFFANRGYAVLQMNFRGSAGQGLEFRNSGLKKWGKEMQDDIEDGALELVKRGITDPDKICIVGASYGGYAALMGAVKTPDRYQCAISVNGVSNVFDLVKDNRAFWRAYNVVDEQIGNDNKTLREISPVNYAEKIKAPVLLIHGELDRQVEIKHSYQMRDALEKAGKNVQFIEQAGEDHYLSNEVMRVQAFKAMDDFLAKHLPVK